MFRNVSITRRMITSRYKPVSPFRQPEFIHNFIMEQQPTILIVDDDREIRTLLADYGVACLRQSYGSRWSVMVDFGQTQNRSIGT